MAKIVGYARVSTREQNLDRQIKALQQYVNPEMIVTDKASGKDFERAGYQSLKVGIGKLTKGDTLYIKSLDRLSRNKTDIKNELQYFKSSGIRLKVLDLPTTLMDYPTGQEWVLDMVNNILIEVLGTIAEQERKTIKSRQREGITAAKQKGVKFGRPSAQTPDNWSAVISDWNSGKITAKKAMELTGIKRTTFYKLVKLTA